MFSQTLVVSKCSLAYFTLLAAVPSVGGVVCFIHMGDLMVAKLTLLFESLTTSFTHIGPVISVDLAVDLQLVHSVTMKVALITA